MVEVYPTLTLFGKADGAATNGSSRRFGIASPLARAPVHAAKEKAGRTE
jgi:hypothetical protein